MQTEMQPWRAWTGAALLLFSGLALACGDRIATRGGQMNDDQGEMNFELVAKARNLSFFLDDHGQPVSTKGAKAEIQVKRESDASVWTSKLRSQGDNGFVVVVPAELKRGDSVTVNVSFPNGSIGNGHFSFGIEPKPRRPTFTFTQVPGSQRP